MNCVNASAVHSKRSQSSWQPRTDSIDRGITQAVVVSLGSERRAAGHIALRAMRIPAIPVHAVSGVGAGDAMVAAITVGLSQAWPLCKSRAVRHRRRDGEVIDTGHVGRAVAAARCGARSSLVGFSEPIDDRVRPTRWRLPNEPRSRCHSRYRAAPAVTPAPAATSMSCAPCGRFGGGAIKRGRQGTPCASVGRRRR